jgi:hypothetical protein
MKKPEVMDRRAYGVLSAPSGGVMIVIGHYRPAFLVSASEVQREEVRLREERDRAEQAELAAQAAADAERAAAEQAARDAAEQAERNALLEAEQKAARDARYTARKAAKKKRRRGY